MYQLFTTPDSIIYRRPIAEIVKYLGTMNNNFRIILYSHLRKWLDGNGFKLYKSSNKTLQKKGKSGLSSCHLSSGNNFVRLRFEVSQNVTHFSSKGEQNTYYNRQEEKKPRENL